MLRIRQLIKRDEIFQWIDNPEIVKVEISHANTKRLKNKTLCDAFVYYKTSENNAVTDNPIHTILGACAKIIKDNEIQRFLTDSDYAFLNGIQSQIHLNFLKASMINKLITLQKKYNINFCISKKLINFVKKYDKNNIV